MIDAPLGDQQWLLFYLDNHKEYNKTKKQKL